MRRSVVNDRVIRRLKAKQRAVSDSRFPKTADLPDEFDYLYHEWIEMKEFVNGLVAKVLSGKVPSFADLSAFDMEGCRRRVGEFQRAHPEVAPPYVALFREQDELLDLVNRASMAKRS
jgi:hypothetical protein